MELPVATTFIGLRGGIGKRFAELRLTRNASEKHSEIRETFRNLRITEKADAGSPCPQSTLWQESSFLAGKTPEAGKNL